MIVVALWMVEPSSSICETRFATRQNCISVSRWMFVGYGTVFIRDTAMTTTEKIANGGKCTQTHNLRSFRRWQQKENGIVERRTRYPLSPQIPNLYAFSYHLFFVFFHFRAICSCSNIRKCWVYFMWLTSDVKCRHRTDAIHASAGRSCLSLSPSLALLFAICKEVVHRWPHQQIDKSRVMK